MSSGNILAITDRDYEPLHKSLIDGFKALRYGLAEAYSSEFLRLTDEEEDAKHDAYRRISDAFGLITTFLRDRGLPENGVGVYIPAWLLDMKRFVMRVETKPRSAFTIIDGTLDIIGPDPYAGEK